jgi:hypothetical protein
LKTSLPPPLTREERRLLDERAAAADRQWFLRREFISAWFDRRVEGLFSPYKHIPQPAFELGGFTVRRCKCGTHGSVDGVEMSLKDIEALFL